MSRVRADLDLDVFQRATLTQVAIGMHDLQFNFDHPRAQLAVWCEWVLLSPEGRVLDKSLPSGQLPYDRESFRVHHILSREVEKAFPEPPGSIVILFQGEYLLRVTQDSDQFESFRIEPGGIVV